jgi:L-ascorbate metabolism protein UlaG (beta-lactamase superfamily)
MNIHHLRNATFIIESVDHHILIDPMLSDKGMLPAFAYFRHRPLKNPLVPLPDTAYKLLERVTHCLITHSRTFGINALQHTDHLDAAGESFLRERNIPVVTRLQDAAYLRKSGLNAVGQLIYWQPEPFLGGTITAVPARHGHGWVHHLMANGAGFYLVLPDEPTIYISGDTVYTADVERALTQLKPDVAVMAAGSARLDVGDSILMTPAELVRFARNASGQVIANHLEALNHCPTTRDGLKQVLKREGLVSKVMIPADGETIALSS